MDLSDKQKENRELLVDTLVQIDWLNHESINYILKPKLPIIKEYLDKCVDFSELIGSVSDCIQFDSNDNLLFGHIGSCDISIYDTKKKKWGKTINCEKSISISYNQKKELLAVAHHREITIWNYKREFVQSLPVENGSVKKVLIRPDGNRIICITLEHLYSWNFNEETNSWEPENSFRTKLNKEIKKSFSSICYNNDGSRLVIGLDYGDPNLFILDGDTMEIINGYCIIDKSYSIVSLSYLSDCRLLCSTSKHVVIFDTLYPKTNRIYDLKAITSTDEKIKMVKAHPNREEFAISTNKSLYIVNDLDHIERLFIHNYPDTPEIEYNLDGSQLAMCQGHHTLLWYRPDTGSLMERCMWSNRIFLFWCLYLIKSSNDPRNSVDLDGLNSMVKNLSEINGNKITEYFDLIFIYNSLEPEIKYLVDFFFLYECYEPKEEKEDVKE